MTAPRYQRPNREAYIITGPTSGYGLAAAHEVAQYGTVVLVGRGQENLAHLQADIRNKGGDAEIVLCEFSDLFQVKRAAAEIMGLDLRVEGLLNNAGMSESRPTKNAQGWDRSYATNHLAPFVLTEALMPSMPDGASIVFVVSAVEDPERKPAKVAGFRGGRYISAQAGARGEWKSGGSTRPGFDAYATTKQCELVAAIEFARETPRLRINAIEPGFAPSTRLGRNAPLMMRLLAKYVLAKRAQYVEYWSTPERSAPVIANILLNKRGAQAFTTTRKESPCSHPLLLAIPNSERELWRKPESS